jgi:hypothetical protein
MRCRAMMMMTSNANIFVFLFFRFQVSAMWVRASECVFKEAGASISLMNHFIIQTRVVQMRESAGAKKIWLQSIASCWMNIFFRGNSSQHTKFSLFFSFFSIIIPMNSWTWKYKWTFSSNSSSLNALERCVFN